MRSERPTDEELGDLVTDYGPPRVYKEVHDPRELTDGGKGPPTKGATLVAAFDRDGRVAAVRKRGDLRWYLPSGRVRSGEGVADAARREAREEAGLEVDLVSMPVMLIARYHLAGGDLERWCPVFTARARGGELSPTDTLEIEEAAWLSEPPDWWRGTWREGILDWAQDIEQATPRDHR